MLFSLLVYIESSYEHLFKIMSVFVLPWKNLAVKIFRAGRLNYFYRGVLSLVFLTLVFSSLIYFILYINNPNIVLANDFRQIIFFKLFWSALYLMLKVFDIFIFFIIVRVISSWFISPYENKLVQLIYKATDALLAPWQRFNLKVGFIDFTPWVAILFWEFILKVILELLKRGYIYF
jgi:YggT family protein